MFKVLIAEDDLIIADSLEEILVGHGYEVCGIARTVADAVGLARDHKPDLAVFDLRLAGEDLSTDIAAQLRPFGRLGILYATGNISQVILTDSDGVACLLKPYRTADLLRSLEIVVEIVTAGKRRDLFRADFNCFTRPTPLPMGFLYECRRYESPKAPSPADGCCPLWQLCPS